MQSLSVKWLCLKKHGIVVAIYEANPQIWVLHQVFPYTVGDISQIVMVYIIIYSTYCFYNYLHTEEDRIGRNICCIKILL